MLLGLPGRYSSGGLRVRRVSLALLVLKAHQAVLLDLKVRLALLDPKALLVP